MGFGRVLRLPWGWFRWLKECFWGRRDGNAQWRMLFWGIRWLDALLLKVVVYAVWVMLYVWLYTCIELWWIVCRWNCLGPSTCSYETKRSFRVNVVPLVLAVYLSFDKHIHIGDFSTKYMEKVLRECYWYCVQRKYQGKDLIWSRIYTWVGHLQD